MRLLKPTFYCLLPYFSSFFARQRLQGLMKPSMDNEKFTECCRMLMMQYLNLILFQNLLKENNTDGKSKYYLNRGQYEGQYVFHQGNNIRYIYLKIHLL